MPTNGYDFVVGKAIPESKVPQVAKGDGSRYLELYQKIQSLPEKQFLPLTFDDDKKANSFAGLLRNSNYAKFRVIARKNVVYVRLSNEEDDRRLAHVRKLREQARQKGATA